MDSDRSDHIKRVGEAVDRELREAARELLERFPELADEYIARQVIAEARPGLN